MEILSPDILERFLSPTSVSRKFLFGYQIVKWKPLTYFPLQQHKYTCEWVEVGGCWLAGIMQTRQILWKTKKTLYPVSISHLRAARIQRVSFSRFFFFFLEVENLQTLEHKGPKWRLANGIPPGVFVAKRKREHEQVPFLFGRYDF